MQSSFEYIYIKQKAECRDKKRTTILLNRTKSYYIRIRLRKMMVASYVYILFCRGCYHRWLTVVRDAKPTHQKIRDIIIHAFRNVGSQNSPWLRCSASEYGMQRCYCRPSQFTKFNRIHLFDYIRARWQCAELCIKWEQTPFHCFVLYFRFIEMKLSFPLWFVVLRVNRKSNKNARIVPSKSLYVHVNWKIFHLSYQQCILRMWSH